MFLTEHSWKNVTNFISNGRTKSAGCLSAVYALMVDWQLGMGQAKPLLYRNFKNHKKYFVTILNG